jgi:hypothetical protein
VHARIAQVNPEALVEIDAITRRYPLAEFDDTASLVLVDRNPWSRTMERKSISNAGRNHRGSRSSVNTDHTMKTVSNVGVNCAADMSLTT